jgi:hypothetical protein
MTFLQSLRSRRPHLVAAGAALAGVLAIAGSSAAATSRAAASPANTAAPTIVGDVRQGSGVAASTGAWTNSPTSFAYQWQRCSGGCSPIAGATGETYVITSGDAGAQLEVVVTATNDSGSAAQESSASTVASLASGAPADQAPPTLGGSARQGQALTAGAGSWTGGTLSYQWLRCDTTGGNCTGLGGATGSSYTAAAGDLGSRLRVRVTASSGGAASSAVSGMSDVVASGSAPNDRSRPTISGNEVQGSALTADHGDWTGDAPITYAYRWLRCNSTGSNCSTVGGDAASYTLVSGDVGHTIEVEVTARNGVGVAAATSEHTKVVASPTRPSSRSKPVVTGNLRQNNVLTVAPGDWSGTSPLTLSYVWRRCNSKGGDCNLIGGATAQTYRLVAADVGHRLRAYVTARNPVGSTTAVSDATSVVGANVPANTSPPTISGALRQGATVKASPGGWSSATGISYRFQWFRCNAKGGSCTGIVGASGQTYSPTNADVGHTLLVQVRAQNSSGSTIANSKASAVVAATASTAVPVAGIALPDRLEIDRVAFSPSRITSRSRPLVARLHVSEIASGHAVAGALVRAIAIPYNRLAKAPEAVTDGNGWATLRFTVRKGFPLRRGYLITIFVRARKPGGSVLAGVSSRRLVSVRVG